MNAVMILVFLPMIAALALLVISFVRFPYDPERLGRMPQAWQLPQSALLVVFALILLLVYSRITSYSVLLPYLILAGMSAGLCGDLFMADVFKQKDHVRNGMIAFAAGHMCYMLAFREISVQGRLDRLDYYVIAAVLLYIVALILWFKLIRTPQRSPLEYAALVYALFLATMAAYAWGLELHALTYQTGDTSQTSLWERLALLPLALGGTLFLLSDTLIAMRLFANRSFPYMGDVIWTTYILAQILIVSVVLVVALIALGRGPYILPLF